MDKVEYYLKLVDIYNALNRVEKDSNLDYCKQQIQSEKANLNYLINKSKPSIFELIEYELQNHSKNETILRPEI